MCIFQYRIISTRYPSFQRIEIYTTIVPIRNLSSKCIYHPKNTNIYIYNIASTIAPAESQIPVRESSFIVHRDSALEFGREESLQRGKWLERGIESRSNPTEVVPRSSVRNSWGRKLQN